MSLNKKYIRYTYRVSKTSKILDYGILVFIPWKYYVYKGVTIWVLVNFNLECALKHFTHNVSSQSEHW